MKVGGGKGRFTEDLGTDVTCRGGLDSIDRTVVLQCEL